MSDLKNKEATQGVVEKENNNINNGDIKSVEEKREDENITSNENKKKFFKIKITKKDKKFFIISIIISLIILLLGFSTVFALVNLKNDKILSGVSIKGINVKGLSKEEAQNLLEEKLNLKLNQDIIIKEDDYETTINPSQIEANYNIEEAVNEAYNLGKDGNIISNNYEIISLLIKGKNIEPKLNLNEELLNTAIDNIQTNLPNIVKQSSYYIEEDELIITKGTEGEAIEKEDFKNQLISSIESEENKEINLKTVPVLPDEIDIQKIYEEVHTEAKDAYYTTNPFTVYPHVNGVDFKISIEEAQNLLNEEKEEYVIPLTITVPKVTTDKIGTGAFPDLLSSFSTKYDASNIDRSTNLKLAANKINGTVLLPGETFSYNKVVGERTISAGYKEAKIYSAGKVVDGLGGGICQISSTLYNAVLYANLGIVERRNHQFVTSYLKAGLDATVVYGSTDFKFKNTRNYPIKIQATVKNGVAKISIYGIKEELEYQVRIDSEVQSSIPFSTIYEEDSSLEEGTEKVMQKGANGCKSVTYKTLLLNGKVVSKTAISQDTYNPMNRIVVKGTKTQKATTSTSSEETDVPVVENPSTPSEPEISSEPETLQPEESETTAGDNVNASSDTSETE